MIFCRNCKTEKPDDCFYKKAEGRPGQRTYCKSCHDEKTRQWRENNRDRANASNRRRQALRTEKNWAEHLRRTFGITTSEYYDLLARQGGVCAICGSDRPGGKNKHFHVDHDHNTGNVRALLCGSCNKGIGLLKDSVECVTSAANYLFRHSPKLIGGPDAMFELRTQ